ncbi:MAG TPA: ABC-F family ATP-binding cassette domain-containing protein [Myxococcales bacterium]|jgi:ATP-binding cassette subfamily F protein 3
MSLATISNLSLSFGARALLDEACFAIGAHDRIGLVGPNGTGKSTLLKILAGSLAPDSGSLTFRKGVRAGYLPQDILELPPGTLIDTVLASVPNRSRLETKVAELEAAVAQPMEDEEDRLDLAAQLADVHMELADFEDRYGRHRAERILQGLGFKEKDFARSVGEFSGGWKMRAALAGLLLTNPDLLLLDEPTNHLDVPSLLWFDDFLKRSAKAVMLVSHDRDFLNRQIDRVLSFEVEGLRGYSGNYDEYKRQRAAEEEELEARSKRQAEERAEIESFIQRFRAKATKARQVQSRIKLLEKQEIVQALERRQTIRFRFPEVERPGREVLRFEGVTKSFGNNSIYRGLTQTVLRSDRVAIIGANGTGKTTLLRLTAGELPLDDGAITPGHQVRVAYFAQHHTDLLDRSRTVLEEVWSLVPQMTQSYVRSVLGAFLFSGDDVDKRIGVLSGGERARVALARLLVLPSNLLLMDEPTNHLDLDSSEKLVEALKGYGGTLLFVSHNRSFVNQLATRVWDVRDGAVVDWPGNLDDYLYHLAQTGQSMDGSTPVESAAAPKRESEKDRRRREAVEREALLVKLRPVRAEVEALEKQIAELEAQQAEIEPQLADPTVYQDFARAKPLTVAYQVNKDTLEELYPKWEAAQARLEELGGAKA